MRSIDVTLNDEKPSTSILFTENETHFAITSSDEELTIITKFTKGINVNNDFIEKAFHQENTNKTYFNNTHYKNLVITKLQSQEIVKFTVHLLP